MTYTFRPKGVCARSMQVEVDDQGLIQNLQVEGGCSGNLQGIGALLKGCLLYTSPSPRDP